MVPHGLRRSTAIMGWRRLGARHDPSRCSPETGAASKVTIAPALDSPVFDEPVVSRRSHFARHPLLRTVGRRLLFAVPLLLLVTLITFVLMAMVPGDAATHIAGPLGSPAQIERLRVQLGLQRPLYQQYWSWLFRTLHGNLGRSVVNTELVTTAIRRRLLVTVSLAGLSLP